MTGHASLACNRNFSLSLTITKVLWHVAYVVQVRCLKQTLYLTLVSKSSSCMLTSPPPYSLQAIQNHSTSLKIYSIWHKKKYESVISIRANNWGSIEFGFKDLQFLTEVNKSGFSFLADCGYC